MHRKSTKEILVESFMELSKKKDINKITIQEIVDNCQLSPATFYRHFTDKYDLIIWEYTRNFDDRFHSIDEKTYTVQDYILETIRYSWDNRKYLLNLLENTKGYQSYIKHVTDSSFGFFKNAIEEKCGRDAMTNDLQICLWYAMYGSVQLVCSWIAGEVESSAEHLRDLIYQCLLATLKPYLETREF